MRAYPTPKEVRSRQVHRLPTGLPSANGSDTPLLQPNPVRKRLPVWISIDMGRLSTPLAPGTLPWPWVLKTSKPLSSGNCTFASQGSSFARFLNVIPPRLNPAALACGSETHRGSFCGMPSRLSNRRFDPSLLLPHQLADFLSVDTGSLGPP